MADTLVELLPVGQLSDRPLPTAEADPVEETTQENVDSLQRQTGDDVHQEIKQEDVPQPVSFIPPVFIDSEAVEKMSVKTEFSFKANSVSRFAYNLSDDEGDARSVGSDDDDGFDPVFEEIKNSLNRAEEGRGRTASVSSQGASDEDSPFEKVSEQYTNIPYGIQPRDTFEHGRTQPDIMGVCYNGRMRQFIFLDSKGIVSWKRDRVDNRVVRSLTYPRHEYRLITYLVYARKHNCYFALGRDFSLKVLNRDFVETCSISADLRSVLFMLFNPVRDELITGGVQGIKVYLFHQTSSTMIGELKPLANYQLTLRYALPNVGGSWVKKVELDYNLEHLYCCSDTDLHVYNLDGKQLFQFQRAHTMSITGCRYSVAAKLLVTSSLDTEVKVWSMTGGLVHTFRGHSRPVTNLLIHPHNSTIIITCSLDGSLRMWSLDTMDEIYSLTVSSHGLLWMGLTDDNLLYLSTARSLSLWHLNHFIHFWSMTRNQVTRLQLEGCAGKTKRVVAVGEDSSIRLFARSNQKNLSTVLPPPNVSPLQKILGVCYSREFNVIFVLINPTLIWVYTTRTDPACRIAVWNVIQIQSMGRKAETSVQDRNLLSNKPNPTHRATESGVGNELPCNCQCVCILKSSAMLWTDEGCCCPVRHSYLLLGMEDGRVLFMDPVVKGQKFMEFKVSKDPVVGIHHDVDHQCLVTMTKVTQLILVQFWSLPDLDLQHEIFVPPDISGFSRIGYTCVTAHESGYVLFHTLELANDPGFHKGRIMPEVDDVVNQNHHPEHLAPVITVDVCVSMKIFCTCSNDGAIKIWEEDGALLTEIMLDETLSAACFLNKSADMIIAFQKHIFFIHHTKVCPHLEPIEPEDLTFDKESYVYEDPAVAYEGFVEDPDPIDLETYLVPYEIEFSKDFLEGRVNLEPSKEETVESDEEDKLSFAPTEIYDSRPSTPGSLSAVDFTLRSEVTKYDLLQQMKSTLQTLIAYEEEKKRAYTEKNLETTEEKQKRKSRRKGVTTPKDGVSMTPGDEAGDLQRLKGEAGGGTGRAVEGGKLQRRFEFPTFDGSPGPTPTITPSSSPEPLSEESEEEESDLEEQIKDKLPPKKIPDMQLVAGGSGQSKAEKGVGGQDFKDLSMPATKRTRKAIADVEIDVASLMKGRKAAGMGVAAVKKEADHSHVGQSSADQREKPHRAPVKKKTVVQHKRAPPREKKRRSPTHEDDKRTAAENHGKKASDDDAHNTQEESNGKELMMETISVDISVVPSPSPERPASSKSGKSVDGLRADSSTELGTSPTGEMYNRPETAASLRDTAGSSLDTEARENVGFLSRPETVASASDAGYFAGPRSTSVLSEGEELHRLKSQASWVSSREEFGQYTGAEEEWDQLSLDETLYSQTRAVSPVSSVFTYGSRGESPIKGDYLHRGDYQLSRMLASQTSSTEENGYSNVTEGTVPPIGTELRRQMSAPSFRSQSSVKSGRPKSAASSRRTSSSSSLCRRPKSAASPSSRSQSRHDYQNYERTDSWEPRLSSGSLAPALSSLPSQSLTIASAEASSGSAWDSNAIMNPESPRVEIKYRPSTQHSCPQASPRPQDDEASSGKASGLPSPGCPPDCVCHLPPHQRDIALRKKKKKISFQGDESSGQGSMGCLRKGSDKASSLNEADDYSHQPQTPVLPTTPTKLSRLGSQGSDAVFEQYDLDRSHGQSDEIFMSPRLPPTTPSLPQSPQQRFSSASSSRHGAVFSPVPLDAAGRDSVLSGVAGPASIADSISEREMFSPDSCLPDAELASISQRASSGAGGGEMYGGTDEDEHRAWSRIGLPDTTMAGEPRRPATTLLPARHIQQLEGLIRQRPYTAGHSSFQAELGIMLELPSKMEELKSVFETALHRYQQIHGDLPGEGEKLYRNTGVHFEDKWYERVLERHMLLRMQRLLRAHAAQQRRQMLLQQRVKSAPQHKAGFPGGQQQLETPSKLSRPKTAHPSILRTQAPIPAAPSSSPAGSRPQTAAVGDRVPSMIQQRQIVQETKQQMLAQREKQQLGEEVPFRLRLREPEENSPQTPREKKVAINPWLLDPRNPSAVRPRSSKSIPSKCSRYVLLSRPRTAADIPTPSPLEEELLATRFPDQSVRLLQSAGAAVRPTPPHPSYGITYTPFSMYG